MRGRFPYSSALLPMASWLDEWHPGYDASESTEYHVSHEEHPNLRSNTDVPADALDSTGNKTSDNLHEWIQ